MYTSYWNLNSRPFENHLDSQFFYSSPAHQATLLKMQYVVENQGAGLLVGASGHGKSTVMHQLITEYAEQKIKLVHIQFPQFSTAELLGYLAVELGADVPAATAGLDVIIRQIEQRINQLTNTGFHTIVVIDDAHLIEDQRVLQSLLFLLNYQQQPKRDCSLFLLGEPLLLAHVERIKALEDRITMKALLGPLEEEEIGLYVTHRLKAAGAQEMIFDRSAIETLFEFSVGVPRKINQLCDLALLVGYADRLKVLSGNEIRAVADELAYALTD